MIEELMSIWLWFGEVTGVSVGIFLIFAVLAKHEWVPEKFRAPSEDYLGAAVTAVIAWLAPVLVIIALIAPEKLEKFMGWIESIEPPSFLVG